MYNEEALATLLGAAVGVIIVLAIVLIAFLVFYVVGLWKLFKKAGKNGWEAIIPFYSKWTLVQVTGLQWWWFLIALVPTILDVVGLDNLSFIGTIAGLLANINIYYNLSKKFKKDTGWIVLSVFFGVITIPLLGYSKDEVYDANVVVTPNGVFDAKKATSVNTAPVQNEVAQPSAPEQTETVVDSATNQQ